MGPSQALNSTRGYILNLCPIRTRDGSKPLKSKMDVLRCLLLPHLLHKMCIAYCRRRPSTVFLSPHHRNFIQITDGSIPRSIRSRSRNTSSCFCCCCHSGSSTQLCSCRC